MHGNDFGSEKAIKRWLEDICFYFDFRDNESEKTLLRMVNNQDCYSLVFPYMAKVVSFA